MKLAWGIYACMTIALILATLLLLWTHFFAVPTWIGGWVWRWVAWASTPMGFVSSVILPTLVLSILQTRWVLQEERV